MKRLHYIFILFYIGSTALFASSTTNTSSLIGSSIKKDSTLLTKDVEYDFMQSNTNWQQFFKNKKAVNRIVLEWQQLKPIVYQQAWSIQIMYVLKRFNENGIALSAVYDTLFISHNLLKSTTDKDKDIHWYENTYMSELTIIDVKYTGIEELPEDVRLSNEITGFRNYILNATAAPSIFHQLNSNQTIQFNWSLQKGAEAYDLEWLFVSAYDSLPALQHSFYNATRITTTGSSYSIHNIFDLGYILYRVRAVGKMAPAFEQRLEGVWSTVNNSTLISIIPFDTLHNWQYSCQYAENGEKKEILSFFDATGKNRQNVTKLSTQNVSMVQEIVYDYEGRSVIQTLPAPNKDFSEKIQFYKKFSLNSSGNAYSRKNLNIIDSASCTYTSSPMSNLDGASRYYSPNNNRKNEEIMEAVPDASLFPYTAQQYDADGKNIKTAMAGDVLKLGSNKENEVFTGAITQYQLDRLFGNNVGDASHYAQIVSKDANGQLSVSYTNLSGQTIASALTGECPNMLDSIDDLSKKNKYIKANLNSWNTYHANEEISSIESNIVVTEKNAVYAFSYVLTPEQYQSICGTTHECLYDLSIVIYDNCNQPIADLNNVFIHQSILGNNQLSTDTFYVKFPNIGSYHISKKLTLNDSALQNAVTLFSDSLKECMISKEDLYKSLEANTTDACATCESECDTEATKKGLTGNARQQFIIACKKQCLPTIEETDCSLLLEQLKKDMSPGGQYFDNTPAGDTSVDNGWLNQFVTNEFSITSVSQFFSLFHTSVNNWHDVRQLWQNSWADTLVTFHPEYNSYKWCTKTQNSQVFDISIYQTNTLQQAQTKNWMSNPVTLSNPPGLLLLNQDPYFQTSPGNADKSAMLSYLQLPDPANHPTKNLWQYALLQNNMGNQWQAFKSLYLLKKSQLMMLRKELLYPQLPCDKSTPPDFIADSCSVKAFLFYMRDINYNQLSTSIQNNVSSIQTAIPDICDERKGKDCPTQAHCFCTNIQLYQANYDSLPSNKKTTNEYHNANEFIAYCFSNESNETITAAMVEQWKNNCNSSDNQYPIKLGPDGEPNAAQIPKALKCEEVQEDCNEDKSSILNYYANYFFQQQMTQKIDSFIVAYKNKCWQTKENMEMSFNEKLYQITLYYYDQAVNLTQTVPPNGVVMLHDSLIAKAQQHRTFNNAPAVYPGHIMTSTYSFNSNNSVVSETSPDAGTTIYFHDRLGRVLASQNEKQRAALLPTYSYIKYDKLGRTYESGQLQHTSPLTKNIVSSTPLWEAYLQQAQKTQVTKTYFDTIMSASISNLFPGKQKNLRKQITTTTIEEKDDGKAMTYDHATHYSYDEHGNIKRLIQDFGRKNTTTSITSSNVFNSPSAATLSTIHIEYDYELISGRVKQMHYNQNAWDYYSLYYRYDADGRLKEVYSNTHSFPLPKGELFLDDYECDARYFYYLHGPLARVELGQKQVQGIDYAYTINGWIKNVNSTNLSSKFDLGNDAHTSATNLNRYFANDIFGYSLHYFKGDYQSIRTTYAIANTQQASYLQQLAPSLYNGNISYMMTSIVDSIYNAKPQLTAYRYDQLNRIKQMNAFYDIDLLQNNWLNGNNNDGRYKEKFSYDANGNILSLTRNGILPQLQMDQLRYYYKTNTNQLTHITDAVSASNYNSDIDNQTASNYAYDEIGNLVKDKQAAIANIEWTATNKVKTIKRTANSTLPEVSYIYDAAGQRVSKTVKKQNKTVVTYYVKDASGNTLATYEKENNQLVLIEQTIVGAGRIGIISRNKAAKNTAMASFSLNEETHHYFSLQKGNKQYELSNHLGNVLTTITDKKVAVQKNNTTLYEASIASISDYTPFGMQMVGRENINYEIGFNHQLKSFEIDTNGNHTTALFWEYDARAGRRWNRDPVIEPSESQYSTNKNNPVINSDVNGDWPMCSTEVKGSLIIGFGNKGRGSFSFGISAGLSFTKGNSMLGAQASGRLYAGTVGSTGLNDVQGDLVLSPSLTLGGRSRRSPMILNTFNTQTPSAINTTFNNSGTLASNIVFNTSGRNQMVGDVSFRFGDVTGNIANDFIPISSGRRNDRWWTGSGMLTIRLPGGNAMSVGTDAFTEQRLLDNTLREGEYNTFTSGNRQGRTKYLVDQVGNRAYYRRGAFGKYNNGQTFLQINTFNGMMYRANFIGGDDALGQQNFIHDGFPSGPIPRFVPAPPLQVEGNIGIGNKRK